MEFIINVIYGYIRAAIKENHRKTGRCDDCGCDFATVGIPLKKCP